MRLLSTALSLNQYYRNTIDMLALKRLPLSTWRNITYPTKTKMNKPHLAYKGIQALIFWYSILATRYDRSGWNVALAASCWLVMFPREAAPMFSRKWKWLLHIMGSTFKLLRKDDQTSNVQWYPYQLKKKKNVSI